MYKLSMNNKQILGCFSYEIISIPYYANISEQEEIADEMNKKMFIQMLKECSRYCEPGKTVFELLWNVQKAKDTSVQNKLRLYFIVRILSDSEEKLVQRGNLIEQNIISHLRAGGFQVIKSDFKEIQNLQEDLLESYLNAIVKAEQCTVHTQGVMPYYFATPIQDDRTDYTLFTKELSKYPGAVVAIQLITDSYTSKERMCITEVYNMLSRIAAGNMTGMGTYYQDFMAQSAKDAYQYIYANLQQPMFRYNFLVYGTQSQCASLSALIASMLQGKLEESFTTVNLNAENISIKKMLPYYPWNVNQALVKKYRNARMWNILQQIQVMRYLVRLPYLITAEEATKVFQVPVDNKKIVGIQKREIVQNVHLIDARAMQEDNIQIGKIYGIDEIDDEVGCTPKYLTRHALVVGMPGTGKTTFSVRLLLQVYRKGIPFLAIEPTKSEYRAMIDAIPELQIFTPGNNGISPFVINPFIPPRGITIEQYIPSLASAFKAAFSMPSPLDTVFQQAIREAYVQYGWKDYSTAQDDDVTLFGLHEFILVFKKLIDNQKYSAEVKGNLQSAGILRLRNLIEQNPNIYDTVHTIPLEDLLSKPTVLELNAIDNENQKSVLMALLLINICVYTKHNQFGDGKFKNLLLIDEAHVLFKAKSNSDNANGGNSTVRSLENMLAEIRSYGTGVVIADQSPEAVGREVIKNTGLKVVFRLVEESDRKTIAAATNMHNLETDYIAKLEVGQAFVSSEIIKEPVLVQTPDIRDNENIRLSVSNDEIHRRMNYWSKHSFYLIPFRECKYSRPCKACVMKLRSDAAYYATRLMQKYGNKIVDIKSLCACLKSIDIWIEKENFLFTNQMQMCNCVKIRLLRKVVQQKDIEVSEAQYMKILNTYLNCNPMEK